jgi:hypothetical protein
VLSQAPVFQRNVLLPAVHFIIKSSRCQ